MNTSTAMSGSMWLSLIKPTTLRPVRPSIFRLQLLRITFCQRRRRSSTASLSPASTRLRSPRVRVSCKTTNTAFDVFAGANYNKEKFSPNPPLVLTSTTRNAAEVLAGEELTWKLNSRVAFNERFTAFPNVSDLGQYRFQFDATAAAKLNTWLSWQVTLSDHYLSNPLPGVKSNDELLSTGLRLTFGKGSL